MKEIIKKVLNRYSDRQLNLGSVSARDMLASEIVAVVESEMSDTLSVDDYEASRLKQVQDGLTIDMWKVYNSNQLELDF